MISTRDFILETVRNNKPKGNYPYPKISVFEKSRKPILDEFKENLTIAAGAWYEVKNGTEAEELIRKIHPEAELICSATTEIRGNKELSEVIEPHDLNDVDVGVIRAQFGVSETGMIWLTEKDMGISALGFLSQHLVILLKPDELVRDMPDAYLRVYLEESNYGCFMLGPSATADIGAYMVRGAQGARSLTVFFM